MMDIYYDHYALQLPRKLLKSYRCIACRQTKDSYERKGPLEWNSKKDTCILLPFKPREVKIKWFSTVKLLKGIMYCQGEMVL